MKKTSLSIKIYITTLLMLSIILFSFGIINMKEQKNSNIKIMEAQASIIAKTLVLANVEAILTDENAVIIENALEFFKENEGVKYLVFNKMDAEKILISSNNWQLLDSLNPTYKDLEGDFNKHSLIKANLYDSEVFHFVYPIKIASFNWGWVHIGFSLDDYYKNSEGIYKNFLIFIIISFFIASICAYLFTKWIVEPIIKLNSMTKQIIEGKYDEIPNKKRNDEIYELTDSFNIMARYLKSNEEELIKSKNELEVKVIERTKELEELNKSLDKKVHEEVNKRQEQEKYLYNQSKMAQMGEMLNNVAHQWRQPLSVITTAISGIKLKRELGLLEEEDFDHSYKLIIENSNYLTKTIDTFNKYTQETHYIEHIELKDIISDIVTLNSDILKRNLVNINLDFPEYETSIETIPSLLSQVIFNILINANNALSKLDETVIKCINIKIKRENKLYLIEIEDNAGGIEAEIMDKIFVPYFSTKFNSKGVGMGLYLSYDIVINQLNGDLSVKNGNNGAIFTIKIPIFL